MKMNVFTGGQGSAGQGVGIENPGTILAMTSDLDSCRRVSIRVLFTRIPSFPHFYDMWFLFLFCT